MKNTVCLTVTTSRGSMQIPAGVLLVLALTFCVSLAVALVSLVRLGELDESYQRLGAEQKNSLAENVALNAELEDIQHAYLYQLQLPAIELVQLLNNSNSSDIQLSVLPVAADLNRIDANYLDLAAKLNIPVPTLDDQQWKMRLISDAYERLALLYDVPNGAPLMEYRRSDGYGKRMHPIKHRMVHHRGVDMKADRGTPIYAPANGVVSRASRAGTFGKLLTLEHGYGFKTKFAHLSDFAVKSGAAVKKGDLIGYVGSTGASTGSHLHYEIHYLNKAMDPGPFLEWGLHNYDQLFAKVGGVPWDSLKNLHPVKPVRLAQR